MEVRAVSVTLRPPSRPDRKLPPVTVNIVLVRELNPPAGETPVEWVLVTTLPVDTPEQVRTIVEYYCVRWTIEILFRTLKSGCRVERRGFKHIDRVLPCFGLYLIVAWRTLFVCRRVELARTSTARPSLSRRNGRRCGWPSMGSDLRGNRRGSRTWSIWWQAWAVTSSGPTANRVRKPYGSASSGCTTWPGPGICSDPGRTSEAGNLWVTTRASPWGRVRNAWLVDESFQPTTSPERAEQSKRPARWPKAS